MTTFFTILTLAGIAAVMVLLCLKVLPQKLDGTFSNKLIQFLHDYFNFKKFYIESVLKFIFVLATVACIVGGVVGILESIYSLFSNMVDALEYLKYGYDFPIIRIMQMFLVELLGCVLLTVVGPVVIRLVYEFSMMFVLLVKNVMEINNKTKGEPAPQAGAPATESPVVEVPVEEQVPEAPAAE